MDEEVRVCLLPEALSGRAINGTDCFCIRVDKSRCDPRFSSMRLASRSTFPSLDNAGHGATRPRINLGQLRAIRLRLLSAEEQAEIIRSTNPHFALADSIEVRHQDALEQVERLSPALLAKALSGKLVSEDLRMACKTPRCGARLA